ncbi:hypothetical protein HanGV4gp012 [Helicoverpa armigera nucleopolyhedrovirus]|nr:hypothetical protein HanGV4gp012 [Helicoverpa armigera nucleopolyhedrovirus]
MWLLLALFINVKLLVYHKMQNLQGDMHHHKLCPAGYNGLNADPFDCNAYYMCPEKIKYYCPRNYQFNLDAVATTGTTQCVYNIANNCCRSCYYYDTYSY